MTIYQCTDHEFAVDSYRGTIQVASQAHRVGDCPSCDLAVDEAWHQAMVAAKRWPKDAPLKGPLIPQLEPKEQA